MFVFVNPGGVVGAPALVSCFILSIFLDVTVFTEVSGFSEVLGVTCTDLFTLAMELVACTPAPVSYTHSPSPRDLSTSRMPSSA